MPAISTHMGKYRWRVVVLLFFATTINYIDRQILGMLKPFIGNDLELTEASYGYIVSAFQAAYAIGLLFVGIIIDKYGTKISYAIAVVIWSLAACLHAVAGSAFGFGIMRFFLGIGESANFPAAIKSTAEWFPKKERALATGIFNSGSNMGAILAPVIVSVVTIAYGWKWAFIITGLLGFIWVIFWLLFYRLPKDSPRLSKAEYDYIHEDDKDEGTEKSTGMSWIALIRQRQSAGICLARFICDWVWWFFLFWTPDFLNKTYGVDIMQMVMPLIIIYAFAALGGVFGGSISSMLINRGKSVSFSRKAALFICACCVIPVALIPVIESLWTSVILISIAAFAHQGWASNIYTVVSDYYPKNAVGSMTGLAGFSGSIGGILAAIFVGQVLEITKSYFIIFLIAGCAYVIAFFVLQLFLPKTKKR